MGWTLRGHAKVKGLLSESREPATAGSLSRHAKATCTSGSARKQGALATREVLNLLHKESTLEWTFLSPSADLFSGERTGKFRLGTDQLLRDANGESRISVQDYALAMIDEAETPHHIRRRFTVGY
jgi:putative NADH-flavin reductase